MLMRSSRWLLCFMAGLGASSIMPASVSAADAKTMTVCQLYGVRQSPPAGDIRLKASAYAGPRHGAEFVDSHCPHGTAIDFRFADHLPPNSKAAQFDQALTGDVMDLSLRAFDAEVIGTYTAASAANPRGLFYVERVDWFKKQPPQPSR
jgi:hypothetical protein